MLNLRSVLAARPLVPDAGLPDRRVARTPALDRHETWRDLSSTQVLSRSAIAERVGREHAGDLHSTFHHGAARTPGASHSIASPVCSTINLADDLQKWLAQGTVASEVLPQVIEELRQIAE